MSESQAPQRGFDPTWSAKANIGDALDSFPIADVDFVTWNGDYLFEK